MKKGGLKLLWGEDKKERGDKKFDWLGRVVFKKIEKKDIGDFGGESKC